MAVHACDGDGLDCRERDDTAAGWPRCLPRSPSTPTNARHGIRAIALVLAAAAAALGQGFGSGEHPAAERVVIGPQVPDGGFESVLVDDASSASTADDGVTIRGDVPPAALGGVAPAPADGEMLMGDETGWSAGGSLQQAWDSCVGAFESLGPEACGHCGRGSLACCMSGCCGPRWCAQVDSLVLWQGQIPSMPFLIGPTGLVALDANDAGTQATPGFRAGLVRCLSECTSIEGNYLWARPFQSFNRVPAAGGPYSTANLAGLTFSGVNTASMQTQAEFQGAEVNWRYGNGGVFTWLTGFRWVEWNQSSVITYNVGLPPGVVGNIEGQVANDLYGWQFGGLMRLWDRGGRWHVRGVGKAGVYYNDARQRTASIFANAPVGASGSTTSFVGEVGVNSTLWITQWLAWRLGYSWFWLTDVAVPQSQFPVSNIGLRTASIDMGDTVFLQGVNTGLEICW
jgi:hypothetical protein